MVEVIVALMLFTVGVLALMSTSTVLSLQFGNDSRRERAGRIVANRLEVLRATCQSAASGSDQIGDVQSSWSVAAGAAKRVSVVETVTYLTLRGRQTDTVRSLVPCD